MIRDSTRAIAAIARVLGIGVVHIGMGALLGWIASSSVLAPGPSVGAMLGAVVGLLTWVPVTACIWNRNLGVAGLCLYSPTLLGALLSLTTSHLGTRFLVVIATLQIGLGLAIVLAPRVR